MSKQNGNNTITGDIKLSRRLCPSESKFNCLRCIDSISIKHYLVSGISVDTNDSVYACGYMWQ